ncbi:hypothetical protein SESBI_26539 [Sesbania bispinosa]|nr:hypothetical protein SESBI_26539 [Sesbania bispinosa]
MKRPLGGPIPDEATFNAIKWTVVKGILWTATRTLTRCKGHSGGSGLRARSQMTKVALRGATPNSKCG